MDRSLFASPDVAADRLTRAASDLADSAWAGHCLNEGIRTLREGTFMPWVPRLALIAALRLGRETGFLPGYEQFLLWLDSVRKGDWHRGISELARDADMLKQSGRLAQSAPSFEAEFARIMPAVGPADAGLVADIGCGGGLWAINLANLGYRVLGTERLDFLVEAARRNAAAHRVGGVEFRLDDILRSELPTGLCNRVLCIGVTPTLPDDAAFDSLLHHLDRITRSESAAGPRRVILGSNRWGPSRMTAVRGILEAARDDPDGAPRRFANAERRLGLVEACWWLQPRHLEQARRRFPEIERIAETHDAIDGTRVDLLMQ